MQNDTRVAIGFTLAIVALLGGATFLRKPAAATPAPSSVVRVENGIQIIDITAKGGYSPRKVVAKAGVPTEIHVATSGTFDCSSALVIPSLQYQKLLEPNGTETIAVSAEKATGTLKGQCSMGMYGFEIAFSE